MKCVAWDLDDTVWRGVAIESDQLPEPREEVLRLLAELERRGIPNSIASRTDPGLAAVLRDHPLLGDRFVAPQIGWEPRSTALRHIAGQLNIGIESLAFVDDDPFARAEVRHLLPDVAVLSTGELEAALSDPAAAAGELTDEARRRPQLYREEERRRAVERGFAGSQQDFFEWCEMRLEVGPAGPADYARLVELGERTHRLNSAGQRCRPEDVALWLSDPRWLVCRARLVDRFGDYGVVGMSVVDREAAGTGDWLVALLAISCRVEGRGMAPAILRWVMDEARRSGMRRVLTLYRSNGKNVPLGVLLKQLGFRRVSAPSEQTSAGPAVLGLDLSGELPTYPGWLRLSTRETG
ncbi:MAG TPA: HAD-IIIC family phosphatase [Candidatus Dormibacteraeota bacterium]